MMAREDEITVLGLWESPFTMRVRIALNLKGVAYEYLVENLSSKSELLVKSNPIYKKVPVVLHGGKPLCESMIIVQYIDDVWSSSGYAILPADPYDRSIARFWAVYVDDKFFPGIMGIIKARTEEAKADAAEKLFAELLPLEEAFKRCSKGKGFFGGDTIGYLDLALGSYLAWLEAARKMSNVNFLNEEKTPLLVGWAERFRSADEVKELMPKVNELVEYAQQAINGGASPAK